MNHTSAGWQRLLKLAASLCVCTLGLRAQSSPAPNKPAPALPEAAAAQPEASPAQSTIAAQQMQAAVSAAQHGDRQQALALAATLLRQHPDFVPALKLEGMLLEDAGSNADALAALTRALKLTPQDDELLLQVGILDLLEGDAAGAVVVLKQRLRRLPHDEDGLYYLAQAYHLVGDNDAALRTIRLANTAHPNSVPVWQKYGELLCSSGDDQQSLVWLQKAQKSDPTLPRINLDLAVASFNSMDLPAAVTYATRETEVQPHSLEAYGLLASAEIKLAQWQDAQITLEHMLAAGKDDASTLLELGQCDLELKLYQASVDALQQALQLDPTLQLAHFYLSRDFNALGQTGAAQHEAALHQKMMQEVAFTMPRAESRQETALSRQARQLLTEHREKEALQLFRAASTGASNGGLSRTPASAAAAYLSVGAVYVEMGDTADAQKDFDQALQLDPQTRGAHTYLGIIALQLADLGRAEREFNAELALDPNHPLARAELGEVRYRQGQWAAAADLLVRSKTAIPALLYMLCDSYFHLGRISDADLTAESLAAYAHDQPDLLASLHDLLIRNDQAGTAQRLPQQP